MKDNKRPGSIRDVSGYINMWTVQDSRVIDTIKRDGEYFVKRSYIQEKYQESAWIFQTAYTFFVEQAEKVIERPPEAESPVWMFADRKWTIPDQHSAVLKLRIPSDQVICFDMRRWSRILNLSYLGGEKDQADFEKELKRQGVISVSDLFETPYYPALKQKVTDSWKKLFDGQKTDPLYVQGAAWEIKQEWIENF